ncbi:MAG TPA: ATP-binding protein [Anaerolineales bacterium]|nr:ATP-binding protein [Anaerolineales bacterium]
MKLNFLIAPTFEGDENKTFIAKIIHVILLILLGVLILALYLGISGKVEVTNRSFFNVSALIGPLIIISLLLALRNGFFHFVAWSLVTFQWLSTVIQVIGSNGVESPALGAFVVTILLAGFLISRRGVVIFGTLSILSIIAVWRLESNDLIPEPVVFTDLSAKFFILFSILAVATALLYMVMRILQKSLERSQTYAVELEQVVKERTQAKEAVVSLNQKLQDQVAELERFTYTVSHDLRSPLVTINGFLGMLDQDIKDKQPERIKADLDRIVAATNKMDTLLGELLELSRIGRIINPPVEIDTVKLIRDAIESVDSRIRSSNVTIKIADKLPPLYGDRTRLREVFENLLDNAAKYMEEQSDPVIEIGVRDQVDMPVFFVKDNGMGIDPQYHEKIFGLFEKLNPSIQGTGIGLALVKRIIETHGGRIWVESEGLNKGSTFYFTIPK